jgi:hypothetical protein
MKNQISLGFYLLGFIGLISAHPQKYPEWEIAKRSGSELPEILSYHIHCLFVNSDKSVVAEALQFHNEFIAQFNLRKATTCASLFDDGRLCMFDLELEPVVDSVCVWQLGCLRTSRMVSNKLSIQFRNYYLGRTY